MVELVNYCNPPVVKQEQRASCRLLPGKWSFYYSDSDNHTTFSAIPRIIAQQLQMQDTVSEVLSTLIRAPLIFHIIDKANEEKSILM